MSPPCDKPIDPALPVDYLNALEGDVCIMPRSSGDLVLGLGPPFYRRDLRQALMTRYAITTELIELAIAAFNEALRAYDQRQREFWSAYAIQHRGPAWVDRWRI